jgi:hypothetical protein
MLVAGRRIMVVMMDWNRMDHCTTLLFMAQLLMDPVPRWNLMVRHAAYA